MANAVRTQVSGLYIDNLHYDDTSAALDLINTVPEHNETAVLTDTDIRLQIVAYNLALSNLTKVWITIGSGARELVYDEAGTGFAAGWNGTNSSYTLKQSVGSSLLDEGWLVIDRTTDLPPDTLILVEVQAQDGVVTLNDSYSFTTAFTAAPAIDETLWLTPRKVRIRFREAMQADAIEGGTFFQAAISGGMEFVAPNQVRTTGQNPLESWIGYWFGATGSAYPANNGYYKITAVDLTNKLITCDTGSLQFKADDGIDKDADDNVIRTRILRGVISSYRIEGDIDSEVVVACSYEPVVLSARRALEIELPLGADWTRYAILQLHDDISINRIYNLHLVKAVSEYGIAADATSYYQFTTPSFGSPADRIKIWDFMTSLDKQEDAEYQNQLYKMAVVLQDMLNVLWHRCDSLNNLYDADLAQDSWIPYLLYMLGNPFRLPLNILEQRRLCTVLSAIYQRVGTARVIEETLAFFLDATFEVRSFQSMDWWILGTSVLGTSTILGPSTKYAKNSYEIESSRVLSEEDRQKVRHIAEILDPLYMHLIRIIEPTV